MNKLSDLELEKRIAEIEGVTVEVTDSGGYLIIAAKIDRYFWKFYNPLTDKAMLLDLMLKHRVSIDRHLQCPSAGLVHCSLIKDNMVNNQAGSSKFIGDDQFPRAVLECIVEANNG